MFSKTLPLVFLLFLLVAAGGGLLFIMRSQSTDAELRRKRDSDAFAIRDALILYMDQHNGTLPASLSELKFERDDLDSSAFTLFSLGTRKGHLGEDVIAEAEQGGNGKQRIVIYANGTVRWEHNEIAPTTDNRQGASQ